MMSIESPTAARVALTAARPSSSRRGVDPDLQGPEAFLAQPERRFGPFRRWEQHPARRVCGDRVRRPAEELGDGLPGDLATDVPERRLERPVSAGVEIDRLEDADMAIDGERVLADEQMLERLEPVHRVTRADADDAFVGLDPDDRHRELGPRHGVPGRGERRVERDAEALETDGADPHHPSIAETPRSPRHLARSTSGRRAPRVSEARGTLTARTAGGACDDGARPSPRRSRRGHVVRARVARLSSNSTLCLCAPFRYRVIGDFSSRTA